MPDTRPCVAVAVAVGGLLHAPLGRHTAHACARGANWRLALLSATSTAEWFLTNPSDRGGDTPDYTAASHLPQSWTEWERRTPYWRVGIGWAWLCQPDPQRPLSLQACAHGMLDPRWHQHAQREVVLCAIARPPATAHDHLHLLDQLRTALPTPFAQDLTLIVSHR